MWTSTHALVRRRAPHVVSTLAGSAAHSLLQCEQTIYELPTRPRKLLQLLSVRLGCHTLPSETGQRWKSRVPRNQRICTRCQHGLGDEKHSIWSLSARSCSTYRYGYARLFEGFDTMQSSVHQGSQKCVMNFLFDFLDCNAQLVGGGQPMRPDEEEGANL